MIICFFVLFIFYNANAQLKSELINNAKLNFGINLSKVKFDTSQDQEAIEYSSKFGFRLGLEGDVYEINNELTLETGFTFVLSQYKIDNYDYSYSNFHLGTHLIANYKLNEFTIGFGPYVNFGLFGTQTLPSGKSVDYYSGNDQQDEAPFKRLDIGLDFRFLYSLNIKWIDDIYCSYRLGLTNIENIEAPSGIEQSTIPRHFSFGLRSKLDNFLKK